MPTNFRVKAVIAYDGMRFLGFQKQKYTKKTVVGTIQELFKVLKIDSKISGSGRTDAGVHATYQVIHFDLPSYWSDLKKLHHVLNKHCFKEGIYFKKIIQVKNDFHSRYCAKKRSYLYIIKESPTIFEQQYVAKYKNINIHKLHEALKLFQGIHDFEYFCKSGSNVKNYTREIYKTKVFGYKGYIFCSICANGFLRSQIRMMIHAAIEVSNKNSTKKDIINQLEKNQITFTKPALPQGLYLSKVIY